MSEIHERRRLLRPQRARPGRAGGVRGPPGHLRDLQPRGRRVLRDRGRALPAQPQPRRRACAAASSPRSRTSRSCRRRTGADRPVVAEPTRADRPDARTACRAARAGHARVGGAGRAGARQPPVDELALRRQRRRTRILTGLVAAMLAVAVGLGGVVYTLVQQRQAQVRPAGRSARADASSTAAPDATIVTVDLKGGGQASFVASEAAEPGPVHRHRPARPRPGQALPAVDHDGEEPKWGTAT